MNQPEIWKDIEEYEGLYQVSNLGRIKGFYIWNGREYSKKEHFLNPYKRYVNKNLEYRTNVVALAKNKKKKEFKVHRLVAKAFIPNPENKPSVNHIDSNPLNNIVENLEWCTPKENTQHAINQRRIINRIHTIDCEDILEMLNGNKSYDEMAEILGVAKGTIFNYIRKFNIKKIYR